MSWSHDRQETSALHGCRLGPGPNWGAYSAAHLEHLALPVGSPGRAMDGTNAFVPDPLETRATHVVALAALTPINVR